MAIAGRKTVRRKARPLQWNEKRRSLFLDELALTSNVSAAERAAEMAPGSAYRERRKSAEFRAAWEEALAEGYTRLELSLLERAIAGTVKTVTKTPEGSQTKEISDRLGMSLLAAHRAAVMAMRGGAPDPEDAREWLARKLAEMQRRAGDDR